MRCGCISMKIGIVALRNRRLLTVTSTNSDGLNRTSNGFRCADIVDVTDRHQTNGCDSDIRVFDNEIRCQTGYAMRISLCHPTLCTYRIRCLGVNVAASSWSAVDLVVMPDSDVADSPLLVPVTTVSVVLSEVSAGRLNACIQTVSRSPRQGVIAVCLQPLGAQQ